MALVYVGIKGDNIYIQIHDNLDSNIVWLKMLHDGNFFFAPNGAQLPFLSELDRNYLYSDLTLISWVFAVLPAFEAYIALRFMGVIISICGTVYLAKTLLGEKYSEYRNIAWVLGLLYGILPYFPTASYCFAILPFFFATLVRLYRTGAKKWYLVLFLLPCVSSLAMHGVFICGFILLFFLGNWYYTKRPAWRLLVGLAVLSIGYLLVDYRLLYISFFAGEPSLRQVGYVPSYHSFLGSIRSLVEYFVFGYYHAGDVHTFVILPVCAWYMYQRNRQYVRIGDYSAIRQDKLNWLVLWIFCNCLIAVMDEYAPTKALIGTLLPMFKGVSFARTLWLNPFLWYLAFAMVLYRLLQQGRRRLVNILLGVSFLPVFFVYPMNLYNDIANNIKYNVKMVVAPSKASLTYREFYAENLFAKVKSDIDYHGEYAVAYGFHPAVLEYNGIATLDGYLSYYSYRYKVQFRKLIAPALAVDEVHRKYFDNWGGRAYMFSPDVSYEPTRKQQDPAPLLMDPDVFHEMKGKYVFSLVDITNAEELGLYLVGEYTDKCSPYRLRVYRQTIEP